MFLWLLFIIMSIIIIIIIIIMMMLIIMIMLVMGNKHMPIWRLICHCSFWMDVSAHKDKMFCGAHCGEQFCTGTRSFFSPNEARKSCKQLPYKSTNLGTLLTAHTHTHTHLHAPPLHVLINTNNYNESHSILEHKYLIKPIALMTINNTSFSAAHHSPHEEVKQFT